MCKIFLHNKLSAGAISGGFFYYRAVSNRTRLMNHSGCLIRSFVARPLNATHALHFGALSKMRSMSHAGPSMQEMEAYLAPVAKRIAEYRLDLETNPDVLDKLASEGKISQHTADYFKKELAERMKSIRKLTRFLNCSLSLNE